MAVGAGGVAYSSDGDSWAEATDSPDETLRQLTGVVWGGALFVSIGDTLLSGDGINWTEAREHAEDGDIIWSGTHFVSVGYGAVRISSNGNDWRSFSNFSSIWLRGVAYSGEDAPDGGVFVGVGQETTDGFRAYFYHSSVTDPVGMRLVTGGLPALYGVESNGTRFVAVGDDGTIVHSSDGADWTAASNSATTAHLRDVAWSDSEGRFVAVGAAGAIVYSSDGDSWTAATNSATSEWLQDVTWAGSQFVAVGAAGTIVHSSDGSSWKKVNNSGTANDLRGIAWNGTRLVAVGLNGTIVVSP